MNRPMLNPLGVTDLEDWGAKPTPIAGSPHEFGRIYYGDDDSPSEVGIWECTPGTWNMLIANDEFCHILKGRWRLTHEGGDIVTLEAGDSIFLPRGWKGTGEVIATVRKVYSITRR